ncbi:MAG: hypothetical protein J7K82_03330 [Thermoproteales archaeon]|nr:hypothetical protein [Thermoproteales archaeon]
MYDITSLEWKVIYNATIAWSTRELARKSELGFSTVRKVLKRFYKKVSIVFIPNFKLLNLLPIAVLAEGDQNVMDLKYTPEFTVAARKVFGRETYIFYTACLPPIFIKKYINELRAEPLFVVKAYEYLRWRADNEFTQYIPELKTIIPILDKILNLYDKSLYTIKPWEENDKAPDVIDLAIIQAKMINAFITPGKAIEHARKVYPDFPRVSRQVVSYHYNRHVRNMWLYNAVKLFRDMRQVPIRIWYFEGREAPALAKILVNIPSFFAAFIEQGKSLVVCQPPCPLHLNIYKIISSFDIEMPYGDLVMSPESIARVMPKFWMFARNGRWVWPEKVIGVKYRDDKV